jgi:CubicO group peptidase (beta-lactamase class C family)
MEAMPTWRRDPEVAPAAVGVDAAQLDAMAAVLFEAIEKGDLFHGAQLAVVRGGRCVLDAGGGTARVRTGQRVEPDTLFVVFSATKGVAALAMLMLYERGSFHYDEPVSKYWPEFARAVPGKACVTIRHVMGHRGGFPVGPEWLTARAWNDRQAIRRAMEEIPLRWTPGEKNGYHAMNFGHVVNELIERVDGRDCGRFAREEIFEPLGIDDFYLGLPDDPRLGDRVAWCYNKMGREISAEMTGVVGEGANRVRADAGLDERFEPDPERPDSIPEHRHPFNRPEIHRAVLPAAGGIATARALARFYAPLALRGAGDGARLVRTESLDHATTPTNRRGDVDEIIGFPIRWGTGWHMGFYGRGSTLRTFGHAGAGGQVGFADPDRGLAFAFVCNGQRKPEFLQWQQELMSRAHAACRD